MQSVTERANQMGDPIDKKETDNQGVEFQRGYHEGYMAAKLETTVNGYERGFRDGFEEGKKASVKFG